MDLEILKGDIVRVIMPEEVDLTNSQDIKRKVYESAIEKGYKKLLLDFSNTTYIDSTGLGIIVAIHKQALMNAGTTALINLDPNIENLLRMTALDRVLNIFDDLKSAVQFLNK
jgi:anti-sigma B factor antagonist